ncbi:hypothetical protein KR222_010585, partial [Zaprionus bogoriensis]
ADSAAPAAKANAEPAADTVNEATVAPTPTAAIDAATVAAVEPAAAAPTQCSPTSIMNAGPAAILAELSAVKTKVRHAVIRAGLNPEAAIAVLDAVSSYDELVTALTIRNGVLEGSNGRSTFAPPQIVAHAPSAARLAVPPMKKPVETWSAIVTSSDPNVSGKQVADKVRKEVASALGVRVHEVRELKRGGAVIRTPSASELRKVVSNRKFSEVGLEVEPNRGTRSRFTVFDVDTTISPENFMLELYENPFKEEFSPASFKKMV